MSMNSNRSSKLLYIAIIGLVIAFLFWLMTHRSTKPIQEMPPPEVIAQKPLMNNVREYVTQTGTLVAYNSVDLVARIKGYLEAVEFTDGTFIKKGKELFIIEPQPYLEQLKEAQASVVVQKASYEYAKAEYDRQQRMYKQHATSLDNVEKWYAKTVEYKAEIDKAVANAAVAAINYSYTHVLAPFDGRIGRHLVDPGNLVGNGAATDLATLEQIDPIYAYFNLNELDLIKIREAIRNNTFNPGKINEVPVEVKMQSETGFKHQGKLNFVNTGLNASTGTMEFRALLSNKDYSLLPGLFVQVRIPVTKPTRQLTIPDTSVQYDQIGPYVLTVDQDNIVKLKRVQLGTVEQGVRAITKGLDAQDNVIISGIQNAVPGNRVKRVSNGNKQQ
ncbi:RND multidrug efflux membrane fusion protein [Legionella maceachernii]|uniref:RND multidrug efflux membrane fusion protein n=2 Tax=Legionellaceae TaxID=444 RepID=A0A0W0WGK6_9GAMM|nr:RND multidrug efflux membrane fusion protein [Legionella maceachernii]SJZ94044.1 RND family efflux transporter, MFP subunit [Legionella maceachernii]SUP03401.1 Probable efflux pump periplasmic linker ttgA precursor [Legionella maceachernii]